MDKRLLWSLLLGDVVVERPKSLLVGHILLMHVLAELLGVRAHQVHRLIVDVLLVHVLVMVHLALVDIIRDHTLSPCKFSDHISMLQQMVTQICRSCLRDSIQVRSGAILGR